MIYRVFFSAIILIACTLVGIIFKLHCSQRIKMIDNLISCLSIIENEMRYSLNDIKTIFEKLTLYSSDINTKFFGGFLDLINQSNGETLSNIWKKNMEKKENLMFYNEDDIEIIRNFGNVLGSGDINTQLKNLKNFQTSLFLQQKKACEIYQKKEKMYSRLGLYLGMLLISVFF